MRRQRRMHHSDNNYTDISYTSWNGVNESEEEFVPMSSNANRQTHRFENTIEAKVEEGDTLQALALRFHCTVADIKRLNKIDKDNEIHARKVVKIPVTVHSVLLGTLPIVHTSGNSSPKNGLHDKEQESNITRNPLEDARIMLNEKLLVASVNAAGANGIIPSTSKGVQNVNNIIMNSKLAGQSIYTDDDPRHSGGNENNEELPLISDILDDDRSSQMRYAPGPPKLALDWSGSDCDMSWVCLFVIILGLCFVIPMIYVIYLAEHPHHHLQHQDIPPHAGSALTWIQKYKRWVK